MAETLSTDALIKRIENSVPEPEVRGRLAALLREREAEIADLRRALSRQGLEISTIVEVGNQLNSRGLDLEKIENYVIWTVMGQCGVYQALLMRQQDFESRLLTPTAYGGRLRMDAASLAFDLDGAFAEFLRANPGPLRLDGAIPPAPFETISRLKAERFGLLLPLIKPEGTADRVLVGALALGEKITRQPFGEADLRIIALIGDMVALSLHNAQLHYRSIVDGLTRTYSRAHFDIHLDMEIERARRYGSPDKGNHCVTLVMLDIDNFKSFNDRFGHPVGDQVLRSMAGVLLRAVRKVDVVARYGGEEFALIFPQMGKQEAWHATERLRRGIEANVVEQPQTGPLRVTASFGIATFPEDASDMRALVARADEALYRAKEEGKNRVVAAAPLAGEARRK